MESEDGVELSLGLSCGSSVKSKVKDCNTSDVRTDEDGRSSKTVDDFKNFLHPAIQKPGLGARPQIGDPLKLPEHLYDNFSKVTADAHASTNINGREHWITNANGSSRAEEDDNGEVGYKRKMVFDDRNYQKKHEREFHNYDLHEKLKASLISMAKEDVGVSEVEGSTSRSVSTNEELTKRCIGSSGASEFPKEMCRFNGSGGVELQGQKRVGRPSDNEVRFGDRTYGGQPLNFNLPHSILMKESSSVGTSGQPPANGEKAGAELLNSGSLPLAFGYSPMQLPLLGKDHSLVSISHPQQLCHSHASSRDVRRFPANTSELVKCDAKLHGPEEGSSSRIDDETKVTNINFREKGTFDQVLPYETSAIMPGISADLTFGGCGSYPNLPWVSTTGTCPNGRTISGVTYRFSANQIKIVCACHGSHMLPEEFVSHASEDRNRTDGGDGLAYRSDKPAASAQN